MVSLQRYDLGQQPYQKVWDLQEKLRRDLIEGDDRDGYVLMVEHTPVYTYGRVEKGANLLGDAAWLREKEGIDIVEVNRGGKITYHGPGQLVVYPIVDLKVIKTSVKCFVHDLESIMMDVAAEYGLKAQRQSGNPGVWIGNRKLGSVGIHIRKGVSIHGFALNVDPVMRHFSYITPCGIPGIEMTSLRQEIGKPLPLDEVREKVQRSMEKTWECKVNHIKEHLL